MATAVCCTCKIERPFSSFSRDHSRESGRNPRCRPCVHDEYVKNRESVLAQHRDYNARTKQQRYEQKKKYRESRFFYTRSRSLKLKHRSEPSANPKDLASLWKKQRGLCAVTGRRLNRRNAQLDHIVPAIRDGNGTIENLRWVHRDVNYAKRDLMDADFFKLCAEVTRKQSKSESSGG